MEHSIPQQAIFTLPSLSQPPLYQINLSLPPRKRYLEICNDYKTHLLRLFPIYDEILGGTPAPWLFKVIAKLILRHVHSKEEEEEIIGISEATGIPRHLVIAFNTFLDLLSGCSSGGVRVEDAAGSSPGIVHFRGLDWGMDALRSLTICVEYVREGKVIARGVTYAGYTGVLTGVREGLSVSLNFRASPEKSKSSLYLHYLKILFGHLPTNPSRLREILLSAEPPPSTRQALEDRVAKFPGSPCYLTFCTPEQIFVFERGLTSSTVHTSNSFLAVTNHDRHMEDWSQEQWSEFLKSHAPDEGVQDLLLESVERRNCLCSLREDAGRVTVNKVVGWLQTKPVLNEFTHYSCIMCPTLPGGGLLWVIAYDEPVIESNSDLDSEVAVSGGHGSE